MHDYKINNVKADTRQCINLCYIEFSDSACVPDSHLLPSDTNCNYQYENFTYLQLTYSIYIAYTTRQDILKVQIFHEEPKETLSISSKNFEELSFEKISYCNLDSTQLPYSWFL